MDPNGVAASARQKAMNATREPERWWMLRHSLGAVQMSRFQGDDEGERREREAREVGARLFRVVREADVEPRDGGPDPRVSHPEGWPKPTLEATQALVASVHERMDALGVLRTVDVQAAIGGLHIEGRELTLLGRMDACLSQQEAAKADAEKADAEAWRRWNARPDSQRVRP